MKNKKLLNLPSKNNNKISIYFWVLLILIILLGSFLRVFELSKQSIWNDEAYTIELVMKSSFTELLIGKKADPGIPPIYILFFKIWTDLFGYEKYIVRIPSVIFGIASIYVIFIFAKYLFDTKLALLSAFLLAISPFHIYLSQMVRPYSLVILLSLFALFFFVRFFFCRENSLSDLFWCNLFLLLLSYTHYLSVIMIITFNMFLLLTTRGIKLKKWLISQLILASLLLPLLLFLLKGLQQGGGARSFFNPMEVAYLFLVYSIGEAGFVFKVSNIMVAIKENFLFLLINLIIFSTILTLFLRRWFLFERKNKKINLILFYFFCPLVILFLISFFYPLFRPRYLSYIYPGFIILLSKGIISIKKKYISLILLLGLLLSTFFLLYSYYFEYKREPWEEICQYIGSNEEPNEAIVSTRTHPLRYCYSGSLKIYFIDFNKSNILNKKGVWLVFANYQQSYAVESDEIKDFLVENFNLDSTHYFRDDSNEISGDMIVYHFINKK